MPYKVWAIGEEVLAADFNDYLQEQVVAVFATTAARDAAIPAPNVGQYAYVVNIGLTFWNGLAWQHPNGYYGVRATRNTAFNWAAPSAPFPFNVANSDPSGSFNVANGLYTCKLDGLYIVTASFGGAFTANQVFNSYVYKSGAQQATNNNAAAVNGTFVVACTALVFAAAGDTLGGGLGGPAGVVGNTQTTITYLNIAYLGNTA